MRVTDVMAKMLWLVFAVMMIVVPDGGWGQALAQEDVQVPFGQAEYARAMDLYDQAQYGAALTLLEPLAQLFVQHDPRMMYLRGEVLFYNLAGTYYKQGSYAQALASYFKARSYYAYDSDLQFNLSYLQAKLRLGVNVLDLPAHDTPIPIDAVPPWVWLWLYVAMSMVWLCLWIGYPRIRRVLGTWGHGILAGAGILCLLVGGAGLWYTSRAEPVYYGVIGQDKVAVYSSPSLSQVLLGHLSRYTIVRIELGHMSSASHSNSEVGEIAPEVHYLRVSFVQEPSLLAPARERRERERRSKEAHPPLRGWVMSASVESWDKHRFLSLLQHPTKSSGKNTHAESSAR